MNIRLIAIAVAAIMTKNVMAQEHAQRKPRIPFKTDTMMVHDPVMAYEDGTYYIYSTGMGIQAATSTETPFPDSSVTSGLPTLSAGMGNGGSPTVVPPLARTALPSV